MTQATVNRKYPLDHFDKEISTYYCIPLSEDEIKDINSNGFTVIQSEDNFGFEDVCNILVPDKDFSNISFPLIPEKAICGSCGKDKTSNIIGEGYDKEQTPLCYQCFSILCGFEIKSIHLAENKKDVLLCKIRKNNEFIFTNDIGLVRLIGIYVYYKDKLYQLIDIAYSHGNKDKTEVGFTIIPK